MRNMTPWTDRSRPSFQAPETGGLLIRLCTCRLTFSVASLRAGGGRADSAPVQGQHWIHADKAHKHAS